MNVLKLGYQNSPTRVPFVEKYSDLNTSIK